MKNGRHLMVNKITSRKYSVLKFAGVITSNKCNLQKLPAICSWSNAPVAVPFVHPKDELNERGWLSFSSPRCSKNEAVLKIFFNYKTKKYLVHKRTKSGIEIAKIETETWCKSLSVRWTTHQTQGIKRNVATKYWVVKTL